MKTPCLIKLEAFSFSSVASVLFLALLIGLAIFAPWVTRFSYEEQNILEKLQSPSWLHWMGTDQLGRDLYSRVIYGARTSLALGFFASLVATLFGTLIGGIAGFRGGWPDFVLMRTAELFYIFPSSLLAILLMVLFGRGFTGIFIALAITTWVNQARLVRNQVLQIKEFPFVEAAHAVGATPGAILFRHILPNIMGPMIVSLTIQIPNNIMSESFLSFIGLGLQPPYSSWGTLANEGFRAMQSFPHLILFPGLLLYTTMLAFSSLGEGLKRVFQADR